MKTSFFIQKCKNENACYRDIRDNPNGLRYKEIIENLWKEYEPYSKKDFLKKAQIEFPQRWWEMYLTVGLLNLKFSIEKSNKDEGPDIKVVLKDGRVIWIEAVAPNIGTGVDHLPNMVIGVADPPENEFKLRLAQSLNEKKNKFDKYLLKGIINNNDYNIIALSSCSLNQFGRLINAWIHPMLNVLGGCGDPVIKKASGADVSVSLFEKKDFEFISGVLYSFNDIINAPSNPESTFLLYLNPQAKNPLPHNFYGNIETWSLKKQNNEEIWNKI